MADKLIFPIGFDLEDGVEQVEKDWANVQKRLQKTFQSQTISIDADISEKVLNKLYTKFEGLIKSLETKAPQVKLKIPDTVDFEQEIKRLKVQLKSINLGELTDNESKDLYLYIRQLDALAKALKEVNKQEQLRQANRPEVVALKQAQAEEKRTRAIANNVLVEQRRAKIATESARQMEISNRAAQRGAILAEQQRAATARREQAEIRLTDAKRRSAKATQNQIAAEKTHLSYTERLIQRLTIVGGLYQAIGFVTNIREVTAEFELQRVALGAIIKDGYEASKMFQQIKAAAVKSPFEIKDLVSYTKQLAAYKIETKDLFDTTMQLADISAGLGVGMERLVLAFGQIRATGYLRASEVRQLTEAGIPIIEELAKKLSEMRGEMVSTGDVMKMISERAISFGMVKEVFDDMTSAGGTFYKAQEKQAETLAGQWSNLKDTLSIMYEEIGRSSFVQGLLQGFIDGTKNLANNWQTVRNILFAVGGLYGLLKIRALFMRNFAAYHTAVTNAISRHRIAVTNLIAAQKTGNKAMIENAKALVKQEKLMVWASRGTTKLNRAFRTLWATLASNPIGLVLTILTTIGTALYSLWENATELEEELDKIKTEGALQTEQEVRNFERLAGVVKNTAQGTKAYKDAMDELKRSYGELLPQRNKDIEALIKEEGAYNSVINAIREKIALQIKESQISAIQSHYGGDLSEEERNITETLKDAGLSAAEVQRFMNDLRRELEEGNITTAVRDAFDEASQDSRFGWNKIVALLERQKKFTEDELDDLYENLVEDTFTFGYQDLEDYIGVYINFHDELKAVNETMEEQTGLAGKLTERYRGLQEAIADFNSEAEPFSYEFNEEKIEHALNSYKDNIRDLLSPSFFEGLLSTLFNTELPSINIDEIFTASGVDRDKLEKFFTDNDVDEQVKRYVERIADEYDGLIPEDIDVLIEREWNKISEVTGVSMDKLQNYFKGNDETVRDWVKNLQEHLSTLRDNLNEAIMVEDESLQQSLRNEIRAFEMMIQIFNAFVNTSNRSGRDTRLSDLKDQINDLTNAYKKFQDLRRYMKEEEALGNIEELFPSLEDFEPTYDNILERLETMRSDIQSKLARSPRDATLIDMNREIEKAIANVSFDKLKDKIEEELSRLAEEVVNTKTAREFYDRILGLTGDRELSATFTMSVYGDTGEDLAQRTVEQLQAAFEGIDLSDAINFNNYQINWAKVAEIYEENQDKILEANRKTAEELIKNGQKVTADQILQWIKELEQAKTYADKRIELAKLTAERIREIESSNLPQEQKDELISQYRRREEEEAARLTYDAFKDSPAYVAMFNNLDNVSTTMLKHLRGRINDLRSEWSNLDPTQLRELQSRLEAIDEQLASRNPFKALADSIRDYYELRTNNGSIKEAEQALMDALHSQTEAYALLEERINAVNDARNDYERSKAELGEEDETTQAFKSQLQIAEEQLETQREIVVATDEAVNKAQELVGAWDKIKAGGKKALQGINEFVQAIGQSATQFYDAFGGFGGDGADAEYFNSMVQGVSDLSSGIANIASGNPVQVIQGIGQAVSGLSTVFSAGTIRKANKEIARQQEILENLEYTYGRLENAIKDALGSDYVKNYQERMKNLQAQQTAYLKQAEAERSKGKNKDKKKIKEYENAARETADEIKDMQGELSEHFLGMGLTDAAREMARSWIEAKKEIGDATKAIEERIAEMIENLVLEAGAAEIAKRIMKPFYEEVERLANDANGLTTNDIVALAKMIPQLSEDMNVGLSNYFETLKASGYDITKTASDLTGISKDIATASEESILGLAAGINTQNFYISQIHANVALITQWVQSGGMATQGVSITDLITLQNQHLSHLPNIAANTAGTLAECRAILAETRRVADNLDRVIKPIGVKTSFTVNTTLN